MASLHRATGTKDAHLLNGLQLTTPLEWRKCGSSLSSTPHAPRIRRELPFISAHPLQKDYRLLDEKKPKSRSTTDLQLRADDAKTSSRRQSCREPREISKARYQNYVPVKVQPFRRTVTPGRPEGVPFLDLSQFNEPDEQMDLVELVPEEQEPSETSRSFLSWGHTPLPPDLSAQRRQRRKSSVRRRDSLGEEKSEGVEEGKRLTSESKVKLQNLTTLLPSQLEFVENRVLSHERSLTEPGGRPETVLEKRQKEAERSATTGLAQLTLNDHHLTRRLRFGARILTQSGRDVHRELCGFFFLVDGSLTIYEFRQFGQRSSALPLVPRAIYHHPLGTRRKNHVYDVTSIRKGATLYFDAGALSSLPATLSRRPLLAIRVTDVDELAKWKLLKEGLNPTEYGKLRDSLDCPASEESQREASLLHMLQGMIRSRLKGRSSKTLVGLGRMFHRLNSSGGGRVVDGVVSISRLQLQQALRAFHISLTPEDFGQLWELLMEREMCCPDGRQEKGLWVDWSIAGLVGDIGEDRATIIRKVYKKLDPEKSGSILWSQIEKYFTPWRHPDVVAGRRTAEEVSFVLFGCLQDSEKRKQETIDYAELEHFYMGVSLEITLDSDFYVLMKNCWSL